jgi:hypothetical protein
LFAAEVAEKSAHYENGLARRGEDRESCILDRSLSSAMEKLA